MCTHKRHSHSSRLTKRFTSSLTIYGTSYSNQILYIASEWSSISVAYSCSVSMYVCLCKCGGEREREKEKQEKEPAWRIVSMMFNDIQFPCRYWAYEIKTALKFFILLNDNNAPNAYVCVCYVVSELKTTTAQRRPRKDRKWDNRKEK